MEGPGERRQRAVRSKGSAGRGSSGGGEPREREGGPAGSGRGRPARAAPGGGRRPGGAAESGGEAAVAVPPLRLRAVLSQLSLGRRDVSEASGLVNQVVSHLIQAIRGRDGGFGTISRLGAGSYYERVKVGAGRPPSAPGHGCLKLRARQGDEAMCFLLAGP